MKKLALFLLVFLMAVVGISCTAKPTVVAKDEEYGSIVPPERESYRYQDSYKTLQACTTAR